MSLEEFTLPFGGKLDAGNQWVRLAKIMPWEEIDREYFKNFTPKSAKGQKPIDSRVAFGALYIQMKYGFSDDNVVQEITENPYMQHFLGYTEFTTERPFVPSMMTYFRKRISREFIEKITEKAFAPVNTDGGDGPGASGSGENRGVLMLDATCAPSDIAYPTDVSLLNEVRETLEEVVDELFEQVREKYEEKPRTYREKARENYLSLTKQRKKSHKKIQKVIKSQLQYIERDFRHISDMIKNGATVKTLRRALREKLVTCEKITEQQRYMYDNHTHAVEKRIVSVSQPYVRPIVRGKASADVEFGAKAAISLINGYAFLDKLSFENFNEGTLLSEAVESYKRRTGCYPEAVLADHIYRNRENRRLCKDKGIRLSGPRLGKPREQESARERSQAYADMCARNAIEGVFGVAKRRYGLGRIMAHLAETTKCLVAMNFFVYNMEKKLKLLFALIFRRPFCFALRNSLPRFV